MDGDNDLEILLGSSGSLVSIDIMEEGSSDNYWSQGRANNRRNGYYEISVSECANPLAGDVNCDNEIDILDIIAIVDTIVNMSQMNDYQEWSSDINQDQIIDILDVIIIINLILG